MSVEKVLVGFFEKNSVWIRGRLLGGYIYTFLI